MKKIAVVMLIVMMSSCLDSSNYTKATGSIQIYDLYTPVASPVGQQVGIQLRLEAENSCWNHLRASLVQIDNKHIRFDGTGTFETRGTCDPTIPKKDTTIFIKPTLKGWIFFQANLDPYPIIKDSIEIQ